MLKFLFKREQAVVELIFKYLETLQKTQSSFYEAVQTCLANPQCKDFDFHIDRTHKFESNADDIRDEIKDLIYSKALIPESRGDMLQLLDALDAIPNQLEHILYTIQTQQLCVPECIRPDFMDLINLCLDSCDLVARQVRALFQRDDDLKTLGDQIDKKESQGDHLERRLISQIFANQELDPFVKLQTKELIGLMGQVADMADKVSRRIHIIDMKRRV
ncbi:DUF47 domain-containing protein [Desulfacinum hydrothermale]|nr:DUF47 family protein [Desulfacinum hydrothermale]